MDNKEQIPDTTTQYTVETATFRTIEQDRIDKLQEDLGKQIRINASMLRRLLILEQKMNNIINAGQMGG